MVSDPESSSGSSTCATLLGVGGFWHLSYLSIALARALPGWQTHRETHGGQGLGAGLGAQGGVWAGSPLSSKAPSPSLKQ